MKTEIKFVDPVVNPGRQIQCVAYKVRNFYQHQVLVQISRLLIGLIESKANNTMASISPKDTKLALNGWAITKNEWANAQKYRNAPTGSLETERIVGIPHENEVAAIPNAKVQRVCYELSNAAQVVLGLDSSSAQTWMDSNDITTVGEAFAAVEDIMGQYFGTGDGDAQKGFDTGIQVPRYNFGVLVQDIDQDSVAYFEPSSEQPTPAIGDVADLPSIALAPGQVSK